jgi:hypothetical protein
MLDQLYNIFIFCFSDTFDKFNKFFVFLCDGLSKNFVLANEYFRQFCCFCILEYPSSHIIFQDLIVAFEVMNNFG